MWSLWRWTYARQYLRSLRKYGQRDGPRWTAVCGVSIMMAGQLIALWVLVSWPFDFKFSDQHRSAVAAGMVLLLFGNYLRFMRWGDADELIRQYKHESKALARKQGKRLFWSEMASLAAPFVAAAIRFHHWQ